MTSAEFKMKISAVTARRNERLQMADKVIQEPQLFDYLIQLIFEIDSKTAIKAAWVFEFVCHRNLELLIPHLDYFTLNLHNLHNDSAIRPVAKVCEFLAKAHTSKKNISLIKNELNEIRINRIIEAAFDWMIGPFRVAVKVYAMSTLYLLGKNNGWVHEELQLILLKDMGEENPGYCARGKKVLALINQNNSGNY